MDRAQLKERSGRLAADPVSEYPVLRQEAAGLARNDVAEEMSRLERERRENRVRRFGKLGIVLNWLAPSNS